MKVVDLGLSGYELTWECMSPAGNYEKVARIRALQAFPAPTREGHFLVTRRSRSFE